MCLSREWLAKTVRYEDCNFVEGDDMYHLSKNFAKTIHEGVAGKRKKKMVLTQDLMLFMLMN